MPSEIASETEPTITHNLFFLSLFQVSLFQVTVFNTLFNVLYFNKQIGS